MKTEEQVNDEYQIPVLVRAESPNNRELWGQVLLCREDARYGYREKPGRSSLDSYWRREGVIPYPTQEQVEAERAKLRPKADPLPGPVRQALDEAGLGCRFDGVRKLVEAIYANPPKVQE